MRIVQANIWASAGSHSRSFDAIPIRADLVEALLLLLKGYEEE